MPLQRRFFQILTLFLLSMWMMPANSAAYCALRDPTSNIYTLFPDATSYKSIVHKIDSETQQQISSKTHFSIHNDELGQHTLYVAMKEQLPHGIIHARSEVGLWGLIEIVWAFDFDLNVVDFLFQRCRESSCALIADLPFRSLLKGKSSSELLVLLNQDAKPYPKSILGNKEAENLANTVIRSAIKTALVTEISWQADLQALSERINE
jgi:hypothetical protein